MDDSRSRRSVASLGDLQKESSLEDQPPDITPIGGVPNLKGKVLVRPIAFRPSPGRPGSSAGPQVPARPGSSTGPSPGPFISRPNSQGFAPGHPLVKDGPRPFGSSQELSRNHPQSLTSSLLSKFSSLDRRSVQQRSCRGTLPQGGNRVPSGAQSSQPIQTNGLSQEPNRGVKEPERRHSLYDSNSRGQYPTRGTSTPSTPASINVNGLPDPNLVQGSSTWAPGTLNGSRTSLDPRSSVEPRNMEPRTRHSGAGTPQFRNLAGLQFQTNSSRSSLSNLTSQIVYSLQRSTSGNNINETQNSLHHHIDSPFKGSTSTIDQDYNSTPSPSDSAVGDLETVLKEKDNEIVFLRETMEQNEQVIFKVYEEKERVWEREIRKIKALYDSRYFHKWFLEIKKNYY
ncbi:leucine zipper putative tumor suppressor 3 [Eurytemora carolleeae]|uniref:leucine zipper putative tumor suppressor 3 n=1 Tax=Eurytemora carolleeae TaxID=1294199 RepID=UPI000C7606E5|nr:leucine zipper putative tumor suppressor 3 [Eurytemora carolleeae]|eukprot:XP_023346462.1 leucine zipper putative tumor suppressor 3-like [Eurytemora affinis]